MTDTSPSDQDAGEQRVTYPDQWVVLGEHTVEEFFQERQWRPDGTWTPEPGLIAEIVRPLHTVLQGRLDQLIERVSVLRFPFINEPRHASEYFVQCVEIIRAGRRLVFLNGFHRRAMDSPRAGDKWQTSPHRVCDGGPWHFRAEYDPATHQIVKLRFNGPYSTLNPSRD